VSTEETLEQRPRRTNFKLPRERHGTISGYEEHRCRCEDCETAWVGSKHCTRCGVRKPLEEFPLHVSWRGYRPADGRGSWCRDCKREYNREWNRGRR
jgi:hypothetical protein